MKSKQGKIIVFIFLVVSALPGICVAGKGIKQDHIAAFDGLFEGFVYYADNNKTALKSENKRFASTLDSHELGLEILKAVIAGPSLPHLESTWPKDTKINSFFITDDGKAYIDLEPDLEMKGNMDARSELLAIYSMVNSLTVNIAKIKMVKILIQGKDALTLAGHIDLEYFYKTNMLIVK
ncbi:MAG: GerMN domain-containing protein [Deltaproteobacteria bacterium]|nr:GerMN domain-containing protein [Deltaproteobacteria bacterium]